MSVEGESREEGKRAIEGVEGEGNGGRGEEEKEGKGGGDGESSPVRPLLSSTRGDRQLGREPIMELWV